MQFQCDTGFSVADIDLSMHMVPGLFHFRVARSVSRVHAEVVVQPAQGLVMYQVPGRFTLSHCSLHLPYPAMMIQQHLSWSSANVSLEMPSRHFKLQSHNWRQFVGCTAIGDLHYGSLLHGAHLRQWSAAWEKQSHEVVSWRCATASPRIMGTVVTKCEQQVGEFWLCHESWTFVDNFCAQ